MESKERFYTILNGLSIFAAAVGLFFIVLFVLSLIAPGILIVDWFAVQGSFGQEFVSVTYAVRALIVLFAAYLFRKKDRRILPLTIFGFSLVLIFAIIPLVLHVLGIFLMYNLDVSIGNSAVRATYIGVIWYYLARHKEYLIDYRSHEGVSTDTTIS